MDMAKIFNKISLSWTFVNVIARYVPELKLVADLVTAAGFFNRPASPVPAEPWLLLPMSNGMSWSFTSLPR